MSTCVKSGVHRRAGWCSNACCARLERGGQRLSERLIDVVYIDDFNIVICVDLGEHFERHVQRVVIVSVGLRDNNRHFCLTVWFKPNIVDVRNSRFHHIAIRIRTIEMEFDR